MEKRFQNSCWNCSSMALTASTRMRLAALALDEFGNENAGFERLADADGVGDQDARAGRFKRHQGGLELVGKNVHRGVLSDVDLGVRRGRSPQKRFNEKLRANVARRLVLNDSRLLGIQNLDLLLEVGTFLIFDDELGQSAAHDV